MQGECFFVSENVRAECIQKEGGNIMNDTKDKELLDNWTGWLKTMQHIRTVSGKVYKDQLYNVAAVNYKEFCKKENYCIDDPPFEREDVVTYLNEHTPTGETVQFLTVDPVTQEVYSVPSQRRLLDRLIHKYNSCYKYNRYLYLRRLRKNFKRNQIASFAYLKDHCAQLFNESFKLDSKTRELTIDLNVLKNEGIKCIDSFDLDEIYGYFLSTITDETEREKLHFGMINGSGMFFSGKTKLTIGLNREILPDFTKGMCFEGASFWDTLEMQNLTFRFEMNHYNKTAGYATNKINFRNCRFFEDVLIRDVRLCGHVPDMEVSFEDARVQTNFRFVDVELGHARLYCFQMIVGDYVEYIGSGAEGNKDLHQIQLVNVNFSEDAEIDFSDVETEGADIVFENIVNLPQTKMCLAPKIYKDCPDKMICPLNRLIFKNCEVKGTLYISNVTELSFNDTKNYSKIIEGPKWGEFPEDKKYCCVSRGIKKTKISNRLLIAVYNNHYLQEEKNKSFECNCSKARDFIMLKENFCANGMYDDEDEALVLYMEFKAYLDGKRKEKTDKVGYMEDIYKFLYATGKYGISPIRIIVSLMLLILFCAFIYFLLMLAFKENTLYMGSVIECGSFDSMKNWAQSFVAELLYSAANVLPFVSQFRPLNIVVCIISALENFSGVFLVGYFSVAVVRKTMR